MILVTSAAYVNEELQSEFGKIPPCFLPLQNKRLFEHQIKLLKKIGEKIVFSLPQHFVMSNHDYLFFEENDVEIIYSDHNVSLSESIINVLEFFNKTEESVLILHGDTLFDALPKQKNDFYVSTSDDNYNWGKISNFNSKLVYSGLFWLENQIFFIDCLKSCNSFIKAIDQYKSKNKINDIFVECWYDFGHFTTYFRSKSKFTTQRVFNELVISKHSVKKTSKNAFKLNAEYNWFVNLPTNLKYYIPAIIGQIPKKKEKSGYELEYLYLNTLNELFVFGVNNTVIWDKIFESCFEFLQLASEHKLKDYTINFKEGLLNKTLTRLEEFSRISNIDQSKNWIFNGIIIPNLQQISNDCMDLISDSNHVALVHGDFCFSNIIYDFRKQSVKLIDPRGLDFEDNETMYGDIRYDIAKISHSVIGLYDFIIAERYAIKQNENNYNLEFKLNINNDTKIIQNLFLEKLYSTFGFNFNEILAITIHLFLSMLPLHHDNKQKQFALLANSFRLYQKIKR